MIVSLDRNWLSVARNDHPWLARELAHLEELEQSELCRELYPQGGFLEEIRQVPIQLRELAGLKLPLYSSRAVWRLFMDFGADTSSFQPGFFALDLELLEILCLAGHELAHKARGSTTRELSARARAGLRIAAFFYGPFQESLRRALRAARSVSAESPPPHLPVSRAAIDAAGFLRQQLRSSLDPSQAEREAVYILLFFSTVVASVSEVSALEVPTALRAELASFALRVLPLLVGEHRFGDRARDLRDLAFAEVDPQIFAETRQDLDEALPGSRFLCEVEQALELAAAELSPTRVVLQRRTKSVFSAYQKSLRYEVPVSGLWDSIGYRAVIDDRNPSTCYKFVDVLSALLTRWNSPRGFSDYIARPKSNGYQSLHWVASTARGGDVGLAEIQTRTLGMHAVAEFGEASHEDYKVREPARPSASETADVATGRQLLQQMLDENGLTLNDFIAHLGPSLEHVPLSHYLELIGTGQYDARPAILWLRKQRASNEERTSE